MKTLLTASLALLWVTACLGQGRFLFNTHDPANGNDIRFFIGTTPISPASGPDMFVQVFAGPDPLHFTPLLPLLALDQAGAAAGYTDPMSQVFETSLPVGSLALIGYRWLQGSSVAAEITSVQNPIPGSGFPILVNLSGPDGPANEAHLGVGPIISPLPEPCFPVLALLALGTALAWRVLAKRAVRVQG